jgi:RimJ/RimL family protein N-acetyltransferase
VVRTSDPPYGIFTPDESEVVGGTGLHTRRGNESLEIGYWIRSARAGDGLATEAAGAVTRVAFDVCGVDRVEIRVDVANARSAAIPRKLGFAEEATLRRRLQAADSTLRDVVVFSLFRDAYAARPLATMPVEAHDAAGARVL